MVYITKFRANDLNPSKGKQIEFNNGVAQKFFGFTADVHSVVIECRSMADAGFKKRITASFKLSPARGDYKIYQNDDRSSDLKDVFLEDLKLTDTGNIDDYYAIRKKSEDQYLLYYVPKGKLFSDFFQILSGDQVLFAEQDDQQQLVIDSLQLITYGAPGTGKSYAIDKCTNEGNSIRVTFHPDTDYSAFVGAYKPTMDEQERYALDATGKTHKIEAKEKAIAYTFVPQAFMKAYVEAWRRYTDAGLQGDAKTYYLVIEEINRGNCAQIFGDLFQLLDRADNGFSAYAIAPDDDIQKFLEKDKDYKLVDIPLTEDIKKMTEEGVKVIASAADIKVGKRLVLPPNLCIWATMNTSDQSLFPIDSAFKRRWDWKYVPIKNANLGWVIKFGDCEIDWWKFLVKINKVVKSVTNSADKQLGYFFVKLNEGETEISADLFVNKVAFYLWNDVFKDCELDGDAFKITREDGDGVLAFEDFFKEDGSINEEVLKNFLTVLVPAEE